MSVKYSHINKYNINSKFDLFTKSKNHISYSIIKQT